MTLQTDLERILQLGQAEVKCLACNGQGEGADWEPGYEIAEEWFCNICGGSSKVPDPRFVDLVEALTVTCHRCLGTGTCYWQSGMSSGCPNCGGVFGQGFPPGEVPKETRGTGRVLRTEWRRQGELAGVLKHWARKAEYDAGMNGNVAYPMRDLADAIGRVFGLPDCNEQAAQLVLKFMEAAHVGV